MTPALKKRRVRLGFALALLLAAFVAWASLARDRTPAESNGVSDIVLFGTVIACDIISSERPIDVTGDTVAVGIDNWIISFSVDSVVSGQFPDGQVNVLVHSPSEFGVTAPGDRFKLRLSPRQRNIQVIGSSERSLSRGSSQFAFAERTYELLASSPAHGGD
jgi:hypothetical protein